MKKSPLAVIFLTVTIDLLGFGIVIPQLPIYAKQFGASGEVVGVLMASYSIMQFIFAPIWGQVSDRVGRRPVLMFTVLGICGSYVVFAFAHSLAVLFLARICAGIAAGNIATAQAYIADVTTEEERAHAMALVGVAFGIGFVFGPVVGGLLAHYGDNLAVGLCAAALSLVNVVSIYLRLPESLTARKGAARRFRILDLKSLGRALRLPGVGLVLILTFITVAAFANLESVFGLYLIDRFHYTTVTVRRPIGLISGYIGVLMVLVQGGLIRPLAKRWGEARLVVVGIALMVAGLSSVPFVPHENLWAGLLLILALFAFGYGFNNPSLSSLVSKYSPPELRGGAMGVLQSVSSLGRIVGPLWGGFAFDRHINYPFITAGVLLSVALLSSLRLLTIGLDVSRV